MQRRAGWARLQSGSGGKGGPCSAVAAVVLLASFRPAFPAGPVAFSVRRSPPVRSFPGCLLYARRDTYVPDAGSIGALQQSSSLPRAGNGLHSLSRSRNNHCAHVTRMAARRRQFFPTNNIRRRYIMYKLNRIAAAVCFALGLTGVAFADSNTGTINQIGSSNSATIDQTINVAAATSTVNQNGDGNSASSAQSNNIFGTPYWVTSYIEQGGNANTATVTQDLSWYASATAQQYGSGNSAAISQTNYVGYYSSATIYQNGNGNSATVTQNNVYNTSGTVWQYNGASGNTGSVTQHGDTYSSALVNQSGGGTSGTTGVIDQSAYSSSATIEQFNAGQAYANINQTGSYNNALIHQSDTVGNGVTGYITQSGDNNSATITQNASVYAGDRSDTASIYQTGSSNRATVTESFVYFSAAYINQWFGSGNTAEIFQGNMSYGNATINQGGDGNKGTIKQGYADANCCGSTLTANLSQYGNGNTAEIDQTGWYQDALIAQNGNLNLANITQNGNGSLHNYATINQTGNSHVATIAQNGSGNNATINQH
jgi:hypothetical protein